ncbi:hypothetical protein A2U01_0111416, partial [Trifolium medium]|nr:hypothetical protein [Trifolium medium]
AEAGGHVTISMQTSPIMTWFGDEPDESWWRCETHD